MTTPVQDFSKRRLIADFMRRYSFIGDREGSNPVNLVTCSRAIVALAENRDGSLLSFPVNTVRATDRGLVIEDEATQLLSNSELVGAVIGADPPTGWTMNSGVTMTTVDKGEQDGLPWITVDIAYTNTSTNAATTGITFETLAPALPSGAAYTFSGRLRVDSILGASTVRARLIQRDSSNAQVGSGDPVDITTVAIVTPFEIRTTRAATTTQFAPGLTFLADASATVALRVTVFGLQLEAGSGKTSFIRTRAGLVSLDDNYPNSGLTGAVVGNPGTLPTFWQNSSMTTVKVLAVGGDGSVTLELTKTAGASATTGTLRLAISPDNGSGGTIAANPGEDWQASIECTVLADGQSASPRLNLSARDATGAVVGGTTSVNFPTSGTARTTATLNDLGSGTTSVLPAIVISAAANTTSTVQLTVRLPKTERITTGDGSGPITRPRDLVRMNSAASFVGPAVVVLDAEVEKIKADGTLMALTFASGHTVRIVAGTSAGVSIEKSGAVVASSLLPLLAVPGALRYVLSYKAGSVTIGFPEFLGGGIKALTVPGFDPAVATFCWFGSFNGVKPCTTAIRELRVLSLTPTADNLPVLARFTWAPRFFAQPIGTSAPIDIENANPFTVPLVAAPGSTYTAYTSVKNKYIARSNGGGAMNDQLPDAGTVGSVEGSPYTFKVVNKDSSGAIRFTSRGGKIYSADGDVITSYTLPPGRRVIFVSDAYNPTTKVYQAGNDNWWLYEAPDDLSAQAQTYEFVSIYGPSDPSNPNRSIIFPPAYAKYHSGIDPVRTFSASMEKLMNGWLDSRSISNAADCMRGLRDACRNDYWKNSVGSTTITTLPTQVIAVCYAYLGVRDAGVGTQRDHNYIRAWIQDRTDQTLSFYIAQRGAGFTSPGVWAGSGTARGNHSYSAGLCAGLAAVVLNRTDYLDYALGIFKQCVADMQSVPGHIGALVQEISRASKSLQYMCLAMSWIVPLAEILVRYGFDAYGYSNGALIEMVNFTAAAVDDPNTSLTSNRISREQTRLLALGINGTSSPMVPAILEPIGYSGQTDPETGDQLANESRVAWLYIAYTRLTTAQAPWRPLWTSRFNAYDNVYSGSIGGAQSTLYPFADLQVDAPPPSDIIDLTDWTLGLPVNSAGELFYNTFKYDGSGNLIPNPSGNASRSTCLIKSDLTSYTSRYFYSSVAGDGTPEVNFIAPIFGSVSTPTTLSNHTRSELRGQIHGTGASATEFRRDNRPRLEITAVVRKRPAANGDIDICQIHGLSTYFLIVVLRANGDLESSMTPPNGTGRTAVDIAKGVDVGDIINLVLDWDTDNKIRYTVSINGSTPLNYVHATDPGWASLDCYFKAGAYHGSDPQESQDYGKVVNGLLDPADVNDVAWVSIRALRQSLRSP